MDIKFLLKEYKKYVGSNVTLNGWVRNHRAQKAFVFIDFHDGTCQKHIQIICDKSTIFTNDCKIINGNSFRVEGLLIETSGKSQPFEIHASYVTLITDSLVNNPIQIKKHSLEFMRENAYLRPRTSLFQAIFRIRSIAVYAIHEYLQSKGFVNVTTPIITDNNCESASKMFQVTTLDMSKSYNNDYSKDFFKKWTGLNISGQFECECFMGGFQKVYSFGPVFRAENSNTKTHISEFWLCEAEIAFCDLNKLINIKEDFFKNVMKNIVLRAYDELEFIENYFKTDILKRIDTILKKESVRITYKDAIGILGQAKKDWEMPLDYGNALAKEHEKFLTDEYFKGPIFITNWPKDIMCFYMKQNDDGETMASADYIVPNAGLMMSGNQREDCYSKLYEEMLIRNMKISTLEWYLDLRKYGICQHSGFALGFDRFLMYITGIENIRDVVPFPRTPGNCRF